MKLDGAIARLLGLHADQVIVKQLGSGANDALTAKISASRIAAGDDGLTSSSFFLKTASGPAGEGQIQAEFASLSAIRAVVPDICPAPLGHGTLSSAPSTWFLVTPFITMSPGRVSADLARNLAKLHNTPAPVPAGHSRPQFGFPVATYCGATPLDNSFKPSWADFFADNRLRAILRRCEDQQSVGRDFAGLVERTASVVVPRLLRKGHLGGEEGIVPVIVHGDLWAGNATRGAVGDGPARDLIYDPSSFYAHGEYELGIMKMFGGFDSQFLQVYHDHCPKTEPVDEYDDRVALYELFHHLNHYAIFGAGYKHGAENIMRRLLKKYPPVAD